MEEPAQRNDAGSRHRICSKHVIPQTFLPHEKPHKSAAKNRQKAATERRGWALEKVARRQFTQGDSRRCQHRPNV